MKIFTPEKNIRSSSLFVLECEAAAASKLFSSIYAHSCFLYYFFVIFWGFYGQLAAVASCFGTTKEILARWQDEPVKLLDFWDCTLG